MKNVVVKTAPPSLKSYGGQASEIRNRKSAINMIDRIGAWLFKMWGWKITGRFPFEVPKFIIAAAPHTSNWDFPLGLGVNAVHGKQAKFAGKASLFRWPFGWIFRKLGGIPVDRSKRNNFVEMVAAEFEKRDQLWLCMAPEGKRARVEKFKTGFYFIALTAKIPIVLCKFDWKNREVFFEPELFWPTGDSEKDLAQLWNYFKGVEGAVPENGIF